MKSFFDNVELYYGNPRAKFAIDQKLTPNQKVLILTDEKGIEAWATGRYERGKHVVWYKDERGRKWRLRIPSNQLLVEW